MDTRLRRTTWGCVVLVVVLLSELIWVGVTKHARQARDAEAGDARAGQRQPRLSEATSKIPLHFEANTGQTDDRVKFVARGHGYTMFLTSSEAVLALTRPEARDEKDRSSRRRAEPSGKVSQTVLRMMYAGANPTPRIVGQQELPGKANYFKGNDPAKWRTNVPTFARVHYQEVYPGIDLVYYGNQSALEYDFIVEPGADPKRITLAFEGADKIEIGAQGDLVLHTTLGALRQRKPFIYQEVAGERREVSGRYMLASRDLVRFEIDSYDTGRPLVIDPTLFYSTFLGGSGDETGAAITIDFSGSAYVTGNTSSADFPLAGAFQSSLVGSSDAYVTKLNSTGSALVYSTYFGGSGGEAGGDIAVDALGNTIVAGGTTSSDFPTTPGVLDTTFNGVFDAFVLKFGPTGSTLLYSTFLGGAAADSAGGLALDSAGNTYLAGLTFSSDFPATIGAFQPAYAGGGDAFVAKLNLTATVLVYASFLGGGLGGEPDAVNGIALDAAGNVYVAGKTQSADFPTTPGAFQTTFSGGSIDAFVAKINPLGSMLVYSTFLGAGPDNDAANDIAVDGAGNAYVTGFTNSLNFPTTVGAFDVSYSGDPIDAFVTKVNMTGSALVYSTYLGASDLDDGFAIAVDTAGNAYVTGRTASPDFPIVAGAFQTTFAGAEDVFITTLNPAGSGLISSTYLGGSDFDTNTVDIVLDSLPDPNVYLVGGTTSTDFPTTPGAFATTTHAGTLEVFVAQITDVVIPPGPTTARVTGQGTIEVPGGVGKFHLIVQRRTDGTISGKVQYRNHVTDAKMKSDAITSLVITGNMAQIDGTCGVLCTFHVEVTDVDDSGTNDTFIISINGGPPEGGTLQKGDVKIQQ